MDAVNALPFSAQQILFSSRREGLPCVGMITGTSFNGSTLSFVVKQQVAGAVAARQAVDVGR